MAAAAPLKRLTFRIGDVFPANDPVARWLTVVQMQLNDSVFTNTRLIEGLQGDAPAWQNAYFARLTAANLFEAGSFLADSQKRFPEIKDFVAGVPREVQAQHDHVIGCAKAEGAIAEALGRMRHTLSHYPVLLPDAPDYEDLRRAMAAHADRTGEIILGPRLADFRSVYADDVAIEIAVPGDGITQAFLEMFREGVLALNDFCTAALEVYFERHVSVYTVEAVDPPTDPPD